MELPAIVDALKGSEYEAKIACIENTLKTAGIQTVTHLENSTRVLGHEICGHSIWEFITFMRDKAEEAAQVQAEPAPKPKRSRSKKKKVVVEDKETKKE